MEAPSKTRVLPPALGRMLKHYRLDSIIGEGGMGVVYRAHDLKLQRPVAIKLLPNELTADPERRKRFLLEARTAARINHPAIAQVYDVDEHDGSIFIAMELVEGKTIYELIRTHQLDLLGSIDVAFQVSAGLAKAHEFGVAHRDIKPANVMQMPDGHVKILDFGVAKLLETTTRAATDSGGGPDFSTLTQTQVGIVKGTPAYMSPEQARGEALDARTDLFSLGVMIFEMVTGTLPFQRSTPTRMMDAIAFDQTPTMRALQPDLPEDLHRIVARCLQKRPADRYPDAKALMQDLRGLRRKIEAGQTHATSLKERLAGIWTGFAKLRPWEYALLGGVLCALAWVVYRLIIRAHDVYPLPLALVCIFVYRHVRHQPLRLAEKFVRQVARLPEVEIIVCQDRQVQVSVSRPTTQLYARLNRLLSSCNGKLFFGQPMNLVIRADLTAEEKRQWLSTPGVRHFRDKVMAGGN